MVVRAVGLRVRTDNRNVFIRLYKFILKMIVNTKV